MRMLQSIDPSLLDEVQGGYLDGPFVRYIPHSTQDAIGNGARQAGQKISDGVRGSWQGLQRHWNNAKAEVGNALRPPPSWQPSAGHRWDPR
jgi:hypothetical protein